MILAKLILKLHNLKSYLDWVPKLRLLFSILIFSHLAGFCVLFISSFHLSCLLNSLDKVAISLGTIANYIFLFYFFLELKTFFNHKWSDILKLFVLIFSSIFIFTFTIRHLTQVFPLAVLITCLGYESYKGDRKVVIFLFLYTNNNLLYYLFGSKVSSNMINLNKKKGFFK